MIIRTHRGLSRIILVAAAVLLTLGLVSAPAQAADLTTTEAQRNLSGLGYYHDEIDGVDGRNTRTATQLYQRDNCLTPDAVMGPKTSDSLVEKVQQVQKKVGATPDGHFGSKTAQAVADWQGDNDLVADGIAGPKTMKAMGITRAKDCGGEGDHTTPGAPISRDQVLDRASHWVNNPVPYSMKAYAPDHQGRDYRTDCSGFVSLSWHLDTSATTSTLTDYSTQISPENLEPGDVLNVKAGVQGRKVGHVRLFVRWANDAKTEYVAWEQTPPQTVQRTYSLQDNLDEGYVPLRYDNITG